MKVLFLDIDGVINPFQTNKDGNVITKLNGNCISNLSRILEETDCKIVISSSWKISNQLMDVLEEELFPKLPKGCMAGCTYTFIPQVQREVEITKYLAEHSDEIDNYVIIDDYDFELKSFLNGGHCVITDAIKGLTEEDARKCIEILNS